MDSVAKLPAEERDALLEQTAAQIGVGKTIVEKDFWVCWILSKVAALPSDHPRIVFKGGTSLSKVFRLIARFSEDIDLTLDRLALGIDGDSDPATAESTSQKNRRLGHLEETVGSYVSEDLRSALTAVFTEVLGRPTEGGWTLEATPKPGQLLFVYPRHPDADPVPAYLRRPVQLELGARGSLQPSEVLAVVPYAAECYPDFFTEPACSIPVLAAERTFWEKAVILHRSAHGGVEKATDDRLVRHYSDLALMAEANVRESALADRQLLSDVVEQHLVFGYRKWAKYEEARMGRLRLLPDDELRSKLAREYREFNEMFFDEPPPFEEVIAVLGKLEDDINARAE